MMSMASTSSQRALRAMRFSQLPSPAYTPTRSQTKLKNATHAAVKATVLPKFVEMNWFSQAQHDSWSEFIASIITDGADAQRAQQDVKARFGAQNWAPDDAAIKTFVEWLFEQIRVMNAEAATRGAIVLAKVPVRKHNDLPALRLHLQGRGKIGKNFVRGSRREIVHARVRPVILARAMSRIVSRIPNSYLPAFIRRAAFGPSSPQQSILRTLSTETASIATAPAPNKWRKARFQRVCHFLHLPSELRNTIYELSFSHHIDSNDEVNLLTEAPPTPALTMVCKQVHRESRAMYLHKFKQFWHSSNFVIDASIFPTGWHVRPQLLRSPDKEWGHITNLRAVLNGENGAYHAHMKKDAWLVKRVGGADPSGIGIGGATWGAILPSGDEDVVIFRYRRSSAEVGYARVYAEYEYLIGPSSIGDELKGHLAGLARGSIERTPLRGQICALLELFNIWS